jgi:hypothetical protein
MKHTSLYCQYYTRSQFRSETAAEDSPGDRCAYGRIGNSRQYYSYHGELGFLVDGWERWCPLLRYHTSAGEKDGLGAIAGRIVQGIIIWRC